MNTNFQPLSEQQSKEINGGANLGIGSIDIILGLPNLQALTTGVGNALVSVSSSVSGILNNLASTISNLLGNIRIG